jgi:hypothetical protein
VSTEQASTRKAVVDLTDLATHEAYQSFVPLFGEGAICRIGTGSDADLVLPRSAYRDLARRQCSIVFAGEGIFVENDSPPTEILVNDAPPEPIMLDWGEHTLKLGEHRFRLGLTLEVG